MSFKINKLPNNNNNKFNNKIYKNNNKNKFKIT